MTTNRLLPALTAVLLVASCATGEAERHWSSQLTPELGTEPDRWRFTAAPPVIAPAGTADLWLRRAMDEAAICPEGWAVVDEDRVFIGAPLGGERYQYVMLVECLSW